MRHFLVLYRKPIKYRQPDGKKIVGYTLMENIVSEKELRKLQKSSAQILSVSPAVAILTF